MPEMEAEMSELDKMQGEFKEKRKALDNIK